MDIPILKRIDRPTAQVAVAPTQETPLRQAPVRVEVPDRPATDRAKQLDAERPQPAKEEPSREQLQNAVDRANKGIQQKALNELRFSVDESTGISIVRIVDQKTGETLRQIPSQEMLEIAKSIDEMKGLLVKQQA
jgi:flagellar protein FlaG